MGRLHGRNPARGLVFVSLPATLVSLDRMTVDIALVCAAWPGAIGSC
jgi:hypothetical protein